VGDAFSKAVIAAGDDTTGESILARVWSKSDSPGFTDETEAMITPP
jgi:hypothetical protein